MVEREKDALEKENAAGLRLLISLLIRFPEIGSLRYLPDSRSLLLHFYVRPAEDASFDAATVETVLKNHLTAFLELNREKSEILATGWTPLDGVMRLTLERDLQSISLHEISLIITLLNERLGSSLLVEKNLVADDEEMWFQSERFVDGLFESLRREGPRQSLVGIREEGRVMVFNQWLKDRKIK